MRAPGPRRLTDTTSGFTLLEVLLAVVLIGMALSAVTATANQASVVGVELAEDRETAALVAREIHEMVRSLDREPSGSTGARTGSEVLALDSLVGARFTPPLRSDRTPDPTRTGWSQHVDLAVYDIDDLRTPTGEQPWQRFPRHSDRLLKLTVTVLENGQTVDALSWWITP